MEDTDSIDMVIDSTTSNIQPLHKAFDEHESYSKLEMERSCSSNFFKP